MTAVSTLRFLAAVLLAAALGGCAIEHRLVLDSPSVPNPSSPPSAASAATVAAAPTAPVTSSALPPPPGAVDASAAPPPASSAPPPTAELSLSPAPAPAGPPAPGGEGAGPSLAAASSVPAELPRIAPGAQPAGLGGQWTLSAGGQTCPLTLQEPPSSRTGWVQAGPGCGGFAEAASWTLSGGQLYLYDRNTRPLGRLTAAGPNRFEGTTAQGTTLSLGR